MLRWITCALQSQNIIEFPTSNRIKYYYRAHEPYKSTNFRCLQKFAMNFGIM